MRPSNAIRTNKFRLVRTHMHAMHMQQPIFKLMSIDALDRGNKHTLNTLKGRLLLSHAIRE